jgi:hypothetical protein
MEAYMSRVRWRLRFGVGEGEGEKEGLLLLGGPCWMLTTASPSISSMLVCLQTGALVDLELVPVEADEGDDVEEEVAEDLLGGAGERAGDGVEKLVVVVGEGGLRRGRRRRGLGVHL